MLRCGLWKRSSSWARANKVSVSYWMVLLDASLMIAAASIRISRGAKAAGCVGESKNEIVSEIISFPVAGI